MDQRHSDTITLPLLPIVALLALCFTLFLPLQTAHAAPQRPLSGCNNNYSYIVYNSPLTQVTTASFNDCTSSYLESNTWITISTGGPYADINAQTDTWITQTIPGGTRYGETGRSSVYSYPDNGEWYYIQTAGSNHLIPAWGCYWSNFPTYGLSYDYNCADMT